MEAKQHISILHLKYKKNSLPAKTEFTCKFKGCNMIFSSHHSCLRNHVAEKDHVRSRPNNNKKVDEAQQAKKLRKETTTSIVDFFNKASAAESVQETQSPNNKEDKWECKWCTEERDDEDRNLWIVCDNCGDKYHLQCLGLQYKEDEYYDIDIKSEEFHCDKCES